MKAGKGGLWAVLTVILVTVVMLGLMPSGGACEEECEDMGKAYTRDGYILVVPTKYDELLLINTAPKREKGLFSVAEKASVQAGKALMANYEGIGWLFDIGQVNRGQLENMLIYDMSGVEVFAQDRQDNYYVFYHPTDVRYMRENNEVMARDAWQWEMLTKWAYNEVCPDFILDNHGLTPVAYDNSVVGIYLAQAAYKPDAYYTISSTKVRPMERGNFNPAPYVEKLIKNAKYERVEIEGTPDGDFVILHFPAEAASLNFFLTDGNQNLVRVVYADGRAELYRGHFEDTTVLTSDVMEEWLAAVQQ